LLEPYLELADGRRQLVTTISGPIGSKANPPGIVGMDIALNELQKRIESLHLYERGYATILLSDGPGADRWRRNGTGEDGGRHAGRRPELGGSQPCVITGSGFAKPDHPTRSCSLSFPTDHSGIVNCPRDTSCHSAALSKRCPMGPAPSGIPQTSGLPMRPSSSLAGPPGTSTARVGRSSSGSNELRGDPRHGT